MKAIALSAFRSPLHVSEHPDPRCGPDSVVLAVAACGLCRSDWHVWHGGWAWEGMTPALPLVMGHEFAGTVVQRGAQVRHVEVGDRVSAPFHFSCGQCANCHANVSNQCLAGRYPGSDTDGGFAEFVEVPAADFNCVPVPDSLALADAASLGCRYMTAWRAAAVIGQAKAGESAVVYGCGGLGLSLIQICTALGLPVIAVDIDDKALTRARSAGAAHALNAREVDAPSAVEDLTGGGAHLSFDAIGSATAAVNAVNSLRRRGRHVQVGLTSADDAGSIAWPADRVVFRELSITGSIGNSLPDYTPLLALIGAGRLDPAALVFERYDLTEAAQIIPELDRRGLTGLATVVISPETSPESEPTS